MIHLLQKPNPFLDDVLAVDLAISALGGADELACIDSLQADALAKLERQLHAVKVGGAATILLRSSRAGAGKSHLLARLVAAAASECFFIPVDVNRDSRPSWTGTFQAVLGLAARERLASPRITYLEELARRLMALAAADLVLRGDVPAGDPAAAIAMLKRDYLQAFDMRGGGSQVGGWMAENFRALLPLMGEVLGARAGVDPDEAVAWLRVLARFNAGGAAERKATLASVGALGEGGSAQAGAKQRLRSFFRLAGLCRPPVLVFDHVDALAGAKKDALQLACMLAELGRQQFGARAILSMNGDVWGASFDGHLPGALEDRLTGREVKMGGIDLEGAIALVRQRLESAGAQAAEMESFLHGADLEGVMERRWAGAANPRDVLRHAAVVWDRGGSAGGASKIDAPGPGESVKDYMPERLPAAESLAEPSTLQPIEELVGGGTPAPSGPAKVDPATVKQMGNISSLLRELKSRREQFVPSGDPGDTAPAIPAPPCADEPRDEVSPLVQRFVELRDSMLRRRSLRLDFEALRRMLSLAGERFPMVESSDFKMSPGEGPTVMKWVFPGNEILFGFEPEHQFRYWQSLIKLAGRRVESAAAERLKLVVFSDAERPFSGAASIDEDELGAARASYLDVIELDAGMVASIASADRVVAEMAKADEPVLPHDTISELAQQLDPLWRRITRPIAGASNSGRAV